MSLTRPQRVRRAVVGIVVTLLAAHLAAGWYFSNRIYTDALDAGAPFEWDRDLLVNDVYLEDPTNSSVTLIDSDADSANSDRLRSSDTFGLVYDGGFGVMTGEPVIVGSRVTRDFTVTAGRPPVIGRRAGMNSFAYPREPLPPMQEITYAGELGAMTGVFQPGEGTVWAIMVHGKGSTPDEQFRLMRATGALGMPSLSIRYRNDEGAPADPSGLYGFGATEWPDVQAGIDYAVANGATGVVLSGGSMGGAIVASYLQNGEDTSLVRGVVMDSPMLDLSDTISYGADQIELSGRGAVPGTVTWVAKQLSGIRFDLDFDAVDYNDNADWVIVPTLIFHGTGDLTVPIETSRELAALSEDVELVESDARHVESWNIDPDGYEATVRNFLEPLL